MRLLAFLVLFQHVNDRFAYPFIYLKPLKGTLFGRSLPVYAIIGSSCTAPEMIPTLKWGSFRGEIGDHLRVGDHSGVGIISGAIQLPRTKVYNTTIQIISCRIIMK